MYFLNQRLILGDWNLQGLGLGWQKQDLEFMGWTMKGMENQLGFRDLSLTLMMSSPTALIITQIFVVSSLIFSLQSTPCLVAKNLWEKQTNRDLKIKVVILMGLG